MFFYITLFLFGIVSAQEEALFDRANELYNQEKYTEAIQIYDQILKNGQHATSLYFNKANAHYKENQLAESIYNYEKALMLDPSNEDVKTNLAFAKNQLIDKIDVIPTSGFSKFFNSFVNIFHFDTWAIITVVLMLLFVISFIKYTLEKYTSKKRLFFIIAGISLLFSLLSLSFAYQQQVNVNNTKYAIVFAKESDVRAEPKLSGEQAFVLHEGTKVQVLDSFQDWTKIKLTNGSIGWILKNDIKQL